MVTSARPYMPGYGLLPAGEGTGLLPWSWAEERLKSSRNYWLVSCWPDGRPHAMPVWGMWHEGQFWFSSSKPSPKARNLTANPPCIVTTEDAANPVVVEGTPKLITSTHDLHLMLHLAHPHHPTTSLPHTP